MGWLSSNQNLALWAKTYNALSQIKTGAFFSLACYRKENFKTGTVKVTSISAATMVNGKHRDYLFRDLNRAEESVITYAVAPGFGSVVGEFFYVLTKIWILF